MKLSVVAGVLFVVYISVGEAKRSGSRTPTEDEDSQGESPRPDVTCNEFDSSQQVCQNFARSSIANMNIQIRKELNASYTYLSMAMFFARDDVAYKGFAKFFDKSADEEREHAQKMMDYVIKRGGRTHLKPIHSPKQEWTTPLEAMQDALQLEKSVQESLLDIHWMAQEKNDPHMQDFIEGEFLTEQVDSIKELGDLITRMIRVQEDPVGWFLIDNELKE